MFTEIPTTRPETPLLDQVNEPSDLRNLDLEQLEPLCRELREFLLYSVGQSGGHFAAGLGVVELTVALHYVFDTPADRLVWDVGHQAYPHKILTGRREQMPSVRTVNGPAAFPSRTEKRFRTAHQANKQDRTVLPEGVSEPNRKVFPFGGVASRLCVRPFEVFTIPFSVCAFPRAPS